MIRFIIKISLFELKINSFIINIYLQNTAFFFILIFLTSIYNKNININGILINVWICLTIATIFTYENFLSKEVNLGFLNLSKLNNIPLLIPTLIKTIFYWLKFILPLIILSISYINLTINNIITQIINYNFLLIFSLITINFSFINLIINVLLLKTTTIKILLFIITVPNYIPLIIISIIISNKVLEGYNYNFEFIILLSYSFILICFSIIFTNIILKTIN